MKKIILLICFLVSVSTAVAEPTLKQREKFIVRKGKVVKVVTTLAVDIDKDKWVVIDRQYIDTGFTKQQMRTELNKRKSDIDKRLGEVQ